MRLARNAGNTLSQEQLFEAVWPGMTVSEDTLTQAVTKLRKAFPDDARNRLYIQTVPNRRYRLCAAVAFAADSPQARTRVSGVRGERFELAMIFAAIA